MTVSRLYCAAFYEKNAELRQVRPKLDARLCKPGGDAGSVFCTPPREGCEPVTPRTTAAAQNFIQVRFRPVYLATAILFLYAAGFTFGMISDYYCNIIIVRTRSRTAAVYLCMYRSHTRTREG